MMYTREKLIELCDRAIVPVSKWHNRDTPNAQIQVGKCLTLLKAGCEFEIEEVDDCAIWLFVFYPTFHTFESDSDYLEKDAFYVPTDRRLKQTEGRDWY